MQALSTLVRKVAATDATVLISGESGTGKELVARAVHLSSLRARGPFIPVNCAAIPAELLESELFGHTRGAFTGAVAARAGMFQLADGGSIFLDEVGETSAALQTKLLRVLQDGNVRPVGADEPTRVDVRVIAATNKDLTREVTRGAFREDLFYRLQVVPVAVPPLRERHLPAAITSVVRKTSPEPQLTANGVDLRRAVAEFEIGLIEQALRRTRGNKQAAARLLGLKRTTLVAKMQRREMAPEPIAYLA